jgi:DNA-binding NarL/FixJ family response regulator
LTPFERVASTYNVPIGEATAAVIERNIAIHAAISSGETVPEVARRLRVDDHRIVTIVRDVSRRLGLPHEEAKAVEAKAIRQKHTSGAAKESRDAEVVAAVASGLSFAQAADKLGLSSSRVHQIVTKSRMKQT